MTQIARRGKHAQRLALLFGHVITKEIIIGHPHILKMRIVDDGVLHARFVQGFGQMRFPHALGQPRPDRFGAEIGANGVCQLGDLPLFIGVRQRHQHRLIVAAC